MDIQKYINDYTEWLKSEIAFAKMGEYYEITTPFLDPCNDYLQLYVLQKDNEVYFSDDGMTINNLEMYGLQLTPARKKQLKEIANQFGVKIDNKELLMKAPVNEFPKRKHLFLQAMLRISDMYMTSRSRATSYFIDDILKFFKENEIYGSENVQFTGKSGFSHNYDFLFPRTKRKPERLCLAINNPNRTSMSSALFAWDDTRQTRQKDSKLIVILNDKNTISENVEIGFQNYDSDIIKWSERKSKENIELLSA